MTQEELDSLLDGVMDGDVEEGSGDDESPDIESAAGSYKLDPTKSWPPPPPSSENKVVHQLDDVTKESEEKATQLFDMLDAIAIGASETETELDTVMANISSASLLLDRLSKKYPDVSVFGTELAKMQISLASIETSLAKVQEINMNVLNAMDTMQYQDIHRQKIERVVNIMRTLSNYMNKLFEGRIDDEKRVSSAKHIHGDENDNVVGDDDIEALIAAFGNK